MTTNLSQLMQMVTLEQLNNMMQQMHKQSVSTLNSDPKDVLSLPIVQKVIMAYEDELKLNKSSKDCKCKCDELIPTILKHLDNHNSKLQLIENRLNDLFGLLECKKSSEHVIDKNQTKLTSFPGFGQIPLSEHIMMNLSLQEKYLKPLENSQEHCLESYDLDASNLDARNLELQCLKEESQILEEELHDLNQEFCSLKEDLQQSFLESHGLEESHSLESHGLEEENITLNIEEIEQETDIKEDVVVDTVVADEDDETVDSEEDEEDEEEETDEDTVDAVKEETKDDVEETPQVEEDDVEDVVEGEAMQLKEKEDYEAEFETEDDDEKDETEEEVATEEDENEVVKEEEQDEEGEEVFEIEIDDVTYFATDEENGILYEVDKDGDIGKKVGIIKDGEPIFS